LNLFYFTGWVLSVCAAFFLFVLPAIAGRESSLHERSSDLEISKALLDLFVATDGKGAILIGESMNVILSSERANSHFASVDSQTGGLSTEFKREYLTALHMLKENGSASWRSPRKGGELFFSARLLCDRVTLVRCSDEVFES
jgi:hypothetical protein